MLFDQIGGFTDDAWVENRIGFLIVECRNRHAPGALPGDAPVGAAFDCSFDAAFAPSGDPLHTINRIQSTLAEGGLFDFFAGKWGSG